jgi:hypothetical protein
MIIPTQRPLPDNTQHSQETKVNAPGDSNPQSQQASGSWSTPWIARVAVSLQFPVQLKLIGCFHSVAYYRILLYNFPIFLSLYYAYCLCKCVMYCCYRVSTECVMYCRHRVSTECVMYGCHRVSTQLRLNIYICIYIISFHTTSISLDHPTVRRCAVSANTTPPNKPQIR